MDRRRARTPAGALLELSALANEKQLLKNEQLRMANRQREIEERLKTMAERERRLLSFVEDSPAAQALVDRPNQGENTTTAAQSVALEQRLNVCELAY